MSDTPKVTNVHLSEVQYSPIKGYMVHARWSIEGDPAFYGMAFRCIVAPSADKALDIIKQAVRDHLERKGLSYDF